MSAPVLIIGAGVSGLTLAHGLLKHGIDARVFERDVSLDARQQGYRFRLSTDGIDALRKFLPKDLLQKLQRSCPEPRTDGNVPMEILNAITGEKDAPLFAPGKLTPISAQLGGEMWSVDRGTLRRILARDLEHHLVFGKELRAVQEDSDGINATFSDSSIARGAIFIGADGAMSKVRRLQQPSYRLADTGARLIFGKTPLYDLSEPARGRFDALKLVRSPNHPCLFELIQFDHNESDTPADYIYWAFFLRKDQSMPNAELLHLTFSQTQLLIRTLTEDWHDDFRSVLTCPTASASVLRVTTANPGALPIGSGKSSRTVLIGDAAHDMSPTATLGATIALADTSAFLSHCVKDAALTPDFPDALKQFEDDMVERARAALHKSLFGGRAVFGMKSYDEHSLVE